MTAQPEKSVNSRRFVIVAGVLAALLILAAGALVGLALNSRSFDGRSNVLAAAIGGPFHLVDQNGQPFTDANLKGKWHLVFFGYTHCPDVCPTTLNELSLAIDRLGKAKRADIDIVFITVDPERDTPEALKSYVASFDGPIIALTGTPAEVKEAARGYRVYYAKHPLPDGDYEMDHSAVIYMMDPQARFVGTLTPDASAADMQARLEKLIS